MENRKESLSWWNSLSEAKKKYYQKEHNNGYAMTGSAIEKIFNNQEMAELMFRSKKADNLSDNDKIVVHETTNSELVCIIRKNKIEIMNHEFAPVELERILNVQQNFSFYFKNLNSY